MPVSSGIQLGAASGSIVIDLTSLLEAERRARSAGRNITQSLSGIGTGATKAQTGVNSLTGSIGGLVASYATLKTVTTLFELGQQAAVNDRTRKSFEVLAAGVNTSGDAMLSAMQRASKGMIADSQLIIAANQAMLLGVATTSTQMGDLLNASRVLGQAMGKDVASSFNDLVLGLGRLSPRILDNLGIANEGEKTFDNFAASLGRTTESLTTAEKMQALMNQVMKAAKPLLDAEKKSGSNAADEFERMGAAFVNAKQTAGEFLLTIGLTDTVKTFTQAIKESADWIEMLGGKFDSLKGSLQPVTDYLHEVNRELDIIRDGIAWLGKKIGTRSAIDFSGPQFAGPPTGDFARGMVSKSVITNTAAGVGGERPGLQLIKDWAAGVQSIERDANSARLDATQSYESQRSETIVSYEKGIARDAQDFAISRARAAKQLADTIAGIGADAAKREADWQADLNESVANITAEGNSRVADLQAQYQKDRERAESNHRDNLFSAAARLDAVAVAQEQRQFARSSREAETDYRERLSAEQANIQERIQQEQVGHQERLQAAREADQERIQEAIDSLAESQRLENEDRALSAARRAEDHAAQLAEMATAQGERLAQIARHAVEERAQLDEEFKAALDKEGLHNAKWLEVQAEKQKAAEKLFDAWWTHLNQTLAANAGGRQGTTGIDPQWFGGFNDPFGTAGAMGPATKASTTSNRTSTINVAAGAISIYATANQSPSDIAGEVNKQLIQHYRELAN